MKLAATAIVFLLMLCVTADALYWPWQRHRRHHRHSYSQSDVTKEDCDRIMYNVNILEPARLERALRKMSPGQRATIKYCMEQERR